MKAEEIRDMSPLQLRNALEDNRQELFNLRFQIATRKIKNHSRIPQVKRDIARINTILRERELMAEFGGADVEWEGTHVETASTATTKSGRGLLGRFRRGK